MNYKKLIGLSITIIALLVIGFTVRRAVYYAPSAEVNPPAVVAGTTTTGASLGTQASSSEKPKRLEIPSIGVNAAVQYVGIKADGSMGTPSNFKDVAWYKYGPVPGAEGSAVIDGHVDNALSLAGVFKHLSDVKIGDDVYVTRNDGTRLHFRVTDTQVYDYKDAPSQKIFATSGGKYLNLITCSGTWVGSEHSYTTRLVVYTTLVE